MKDNTMEKKRDLTEEGQREYQEWRDALLANPEFRALYEEEAAKKELWLQLAEARNHKHPNSPYRRNALYRGHH